MFWVGLALQSNLTVCPMVTIWILGSDIVITMGCEVPGDTGNIEYFFSKIKHIILDIYST